MLQHFKKRAICALLNGFRPSNSSIIFEDKII